MVNLEEEEEDGGEERMGSRANMTDRRNAIIWILEAQVEEGNSTRRGATNGRAAPKLKAL
jgi:hypothetical protein